MPKAPPPSATLPFQGRRDWPIDDKVDDWGLTAKQQESYVEQFRRILDAKKAWREDEDDYFTLRRFLRARSYDLEKATTMWLNHIAWKKEFGVDTILSDFHFHERDAFVAAYPQGYHKLDKVGRPVYIQQIGKIDVAKLKKICSEERMLKYHIQEYERCRKVILPICSRLAGRHLDQTFGIMDVSGVGLGHLTGEVKRLMSLVTKYDQDNYPEMLGHICIINAPAVFRMIWGFVKGLIDPRTQSKIEILGPNYKEAVLKWVDEENLPIWLGGKSAGQLVDDIGPWSDADLCAKIGVSVEDLRAGKKLAPLPSASGAASAAAAGPSMEGPRQSLQSAGLLIKAPSGMGRAESAASDVFASPNGSIVESGSRRFSGVPELVVTDTMRRYAASQASASSMGSRDAVRGPSDVHADLLANAHGAGVPGPRSKPLTLAERIAALESALPPNTAPPRRQAQAAENGASTALATAAARSTRSAAEGSLLNRVEVLEDAIEVLLCAQDASLQLQQQLQLQQERQRQAEAAAAAKSGCCVVM